MALVDAPSPPDRPGRPVRPARADEAAADRAISRARELLQASLDDESRRERRRRRRLGRLLADQAGRALIFALTDEVLRAPDAAVAARRFADLVRRHRTTALGAVDSVLLRLGATIAPWLPTAVMPFVTRRVRAETRGVVLPADDPHLGRHIAQRRRDGVALNINPLGEAILSDAEADARFETILATIARPDVDYVSVKVSSMLANLDVLAFDTTVERIADRLRVLYRAAHAASPQVFVNLDMEEYRDLELTLVSFMTVLDEPDLRAHDAGIVLQAYLPDSHGAAERLGTWAVQRHGRGGGRVKVRLVKGANLAMESVDAEMHGLALAPYRSKLAVDASYKRLLDVLLQPAWAHAVRVGVASHNLFDLCWAIDRIAEAGAADRVDIEMLEAMAPAQARALVEHTDRLLLYSPVVGKADFDACIAYLSRRLDENTQRDNFLRSLFTLTPDSEEFERQAALFRHSVLGRHTVPRVPNRHAPASSVVSDAFSNEPDSDMTDPVVRREIVAAMARVERPPIDRIDSVEGIDAVVARAIAAPVADIATRRRWLLDTAAVMRAGRFDTLALLADETGKTIHQGDAEVAEAIDFCEYDAHVGLADLERLDADGFDVAPCGVVAVVGPWNFPYAIPTGGVAAALAAGNAVVLKPAPEAVHVGARVAEHFWKAGVPRDVLQLVVCDDGDVGTHLVTHPDVDTIVLTGSYDTARCFLDWRPDRRVLAETSGKNALVITATADLDDAISDLITSAFGHAGQKCSAASIAIVESSLYDDPAFMTRLRDAAASLRVGWPSRLDSMMGPLIAPPTGPLRRALTRLDDGESWLVEPQRLDDSGRLWSPGIRTDVQPGSWFHRTECFGPVLGLMRARDLDHAIEIQNDTDFGLTGGLHALDPAEIDHWLDCVDVGNAYVNRGITGAIVQRQPFGGRKLSSVGGGVKAGGPHVVRQLARVSGGDRSIDAACSSFRRTWHDHFSADHDPSGLASESNVLRYTPLHTVLVRHDGSDPAGLELLRLAAGVTGVGLVESSDEHGPAVSADGEVDIGVDRVRVLGDCLTTAEMRAYHAANIPVDRSVPVADGMTELIRWVREQSVSRRTHRHGRLTAADCD